MKIFVFGANGMAGSYVYNYINGAIPVTRAEVDATLVRTPMFFDSLNKLNIASGDVLINTMGITNKRKESDEDFFLVNAKFPNVLADYCESNNIKMIHISTDCVFDGSKGGYTEHDVISAKDIYGRSKAQGEPSNCTVIRTSIIGENRNSNSDLLEWVRSHKNTDIVGWTNHYWNGITCLQFAKVCRLIIDNDKFWNGIRHIHSPEPVSKSWLVNEINKIYELGNTVKYKMVPVSCDRTLKSNYDFSWLGIPTISRQIYEQKGWIYNFS